MFSPYRMGMGFVIASGLLAIAPSGCDLPWLNPEPPSGLTVNIQVDAELEDTEGLNKIMAELEARGIHTTLFVTADYVNKGNALLIRGLYQKGHEIALHGFYSAETLTSMTYEEQLDLLTRAKTALEGCRPCGTYMPITGFRPQYFSQNEDTYKVLESLGFEYNCGFKAGLQYIEGHESDFAPYAVATADYRFTAVPFTVVPVGEANIYLCDLAAGSSEMLTGEQWSDVLENAVDQAIANDQPLIALFHGYYTGAADRTDYWDAFIALLDRLEAENAHSVTTSQLVAEYAE